MSQQRRRRDGGTPDRRKDPQVNSRTADEGRGGDVDEPQFRGGKGTKETEETKVTRRARKPRKPPLEHVLQWVKDIERGPVTPGEDRYIPNGPRNAVFLKTEHQRWREEAYAYL